MIRIRPYRNSDEAEILSWSLDEDTFYKWSFGWLGEYPLTQEKFRKTHKKQTASGSAPEGIKKRTKKMRPESSRILLFSL